MFLTPASDIQKRQLGTKALPPASSSMPNVKGYTRLDTRSLDQQHGQSRSKVENCNDILIILDSQGYRAACSAGCESTAFRSTPSSEHGLLGLEWP